jgi:hypothetical protein
VTEVEVHVERKTTMNKALVIKILENSLIEHVKVFQYHVKHISPMKTNFDYLVQALLLLNSMLNSLDMLVVLVSSSTSYVRWLLRHSRISC